MAFLAGSKDNIQHFRYLRLILLDFIFISILFVKKIIIIIFTVSFNIYSCLSPGRIWHKVFFYSEDLEEGEIAHDPRLVRCRSNAGHRITRCNMNFDSFC